MGLFATAFEYACDLVNWKTDKQEEAIYNAARSGGLKAVTTMTLYHSFLVALHRWLQKFMIVKGIC